MLPAGNMEDETCRISLHQHIAAAPPASAIRAIKATDFSIAAIIGNSSNNKPSHNGDFLVKPSSPESANSKPVPLFNFGKSHFVNNDWKTVECHTDSHRIDPVLTKVVLPKQETSPCKTETESDIDVEKDVDVEEFSDAENVSASSPSALSCEDEQEAEDYEDDEDAKSKSSNSNNKHGGKSGRGKKKNRSEPVNHLIKPRCNCDELTAVDCQLETKELWDKFHELGTEMIITKTGRLVIITNGFYFRFVLFALSAVKFLNRLFSSFN